MPVALMSTLPAGRPARISSLALPAVVLYIFKLTDGCAGDRDAFHHQAQARQPRCRAVDNDDALGAVSATALPDLGRKVQHQQKATAEPPAPSMSRWPPLRPNWPGPRMASSAEAAVDGIGRPANQLAVIFGDAGDFLRCLRVGARRGRKRRTVPLVGSDRAGRSCARSPARPCASGSRLMCATTSHLTRRRGVDWEIDAHQRRDED